MEKETMAKADENKRAEQLRKREELSRELIEENALHQQLPKTKRARLACPNTNELTGRAARRNQNQEEGKLGRPKNYLEGQCDHLNDTTPGLKE